MNLPDRAFVGTGRFSAIVLASILVGVAACVTRIAWPSIVEGGVSFFTGATWSPDHRVYGALALVWGTFVTSVIALALSLPIGLGVAVFLSDLGPASLRRPVSSLVELLAAIPSVVYGLWAALVLAPVLQARLEPGGPPLGLALLCASLVLAIMVLPTIAAVARDVLVAVPADLREGALALGATRWDVVRLVVVPHARRGLYGAILLGFGRAVGETMAVAAVAPGLTMSSVIANEWPIARSESHVSALAEVGLLLFAVTVAFNVAARFLVAPRATA
jgi:phosphate transport system permease protein